MAPKARAATSSSGQCEASPATVVTEYRGLTVADLAELRRSLSGTATYTVAKNTLVKRAAAEFTGFPSSTSMASGLCQTPSDA